MNEPIYAFAREPRIHIIGECKRTTHRVSRGFPGRRIAVSGKPQCGLRVDQFVLATTPPLSKPLLPMTRRPYGFTENLQDSTFRITKQEYRRRGLFLV